MAFEEEIFGLVDEGRHEEAARRILERVGPAVRTFLQAMLRYPQAAAQVFEVWVGDLRRAVPELRRLVRVSVRATALGLAKDAAYRWRPGDDGAGFGQIDPHRRPPPALPSLDLRALQAEPAPGPEHQAALAWARLLQRYLDEARLSPEEVAAVRGTRDPP